MKCFHAVMLAAFLGLWSCAGAEQNRKLVCILYDLSESTNTQEIRNLYLATTKTVLQEMQPGDVLFAALITERSVSEPRYGFIYTFPIFKPSSDNFITIKREEKEFGPKIRMKKDSLLQVAKQVLTNPPRRIVRTEILSALQVAERFFPRLSERRERTGRFLEKIGREVYPFRKIAL